MKNLLHEIEKYLPETLGLWMLTVTEKNHVTQSVKPQEENFVSGKDF